VFKEKLYLAWKPDHPNIIKYQRIDEDSRLELPEPLTIDAQNIVSGPVLGTTSSEIFFAWLAGPKRPDETYDIWIAESSDGETFEPFNYSRQNRHAHSFYPPAFSACGDVIAIYWIQETRVHRAEINPDETDYDSARPREPGVIDFHAAVYQKFARYSHQPVPPPCPIGVATAYGAGRRWLFVTLSDDTVWVVPPPGDEIYSLDKVETFSSERVGATLVLDHSNIFVVWKDYRDLNYREAKILV
jgi:hypothetical protein